MNKSEKLHTRLIERREFITNSIKAAGAITLPVAFLAVPETGRSNNRALQTGSYTVQDVINIILKEIPGAPFKQTVDTIKSGNADQQVTGIVTTMFPTVDVIREAVKKNANFIIAHEPSFYNHTDDTKWVAQNDVLKQKQELLQQHQIVIWRFHDYWHAYRPDGILYGVLKKAGWLSYFQPGKWVINIPSVSLRDLVDHCKTSLGISHVKVIGDLSQKCEKIGLIPGGAGGQIQITLAENEKPDVLIVGEVHEWETAEYIRDGRLLGSKTSLVVLGHSVSEEPGMEWLVEWLQPRVPGLPITHIASGDPFIWM